jgi:hypothetical protein
MRKTKLIPLSLVALGLAAGPAYAQSATEDAYSSMPISVPPRSGVEAAAVSNTPAAAGPAAAPIAATPSPSVSSPSGSLPFTGLDLGIVVALAVGLTGLGLALRRATRTSAG